jgi:hypothetical protein
MGLAALMLIACASVAHADAPAKDKGAYVSGGLGIGIPMGDLDDGADTSIGIRTELGYRASGLLSVYGVFRYFFVDSETSLVDISYLDAGIGLEVGHRLAPSVRLFGAAEFLMARTAVDTILGDDSETDPAVSVRGGAAFAIQPGKVDLVGAVGLTEIFTDVEGFDSARWLEMSASVRAYF